MQEEGEKEKEDVSPVKLWKKKIIVNCHSALKQRVSQAELELPGRVCWEKWSGGKWGGGLRTAAVVL